MALIDYRILQNAPGSYLGAGLEGFDKGQQARDAMLQRQAQAEQRKQQQAQQQQEAQAQMRKQAFESNARGLLSSYGEFAYTPEGRKGLLTDLTKAGFGPEAMGLFGQMADTMPPKPVADEWKPLPGAEAPTLYRGGTGEVKTTGVAGKPEKPAIPKEYKPVKNKAGKVVGWDPRTGLGMDGKPVEFWQEPKEPKGEKALTGKDVFGMEQQLRTQYLGQTKDFRDVRDAFGRIKVSAKDPSAAGDLALIFNYMKMLDPGSTVRESEFATAAASGSLGDRFVAAGKKLLSGERLDPTQRADFLNRAQSLYGQQQRQMEKAKFETRKMASSYPGLNPDRILMDAELANEAPDAAPTPKSLTKPEEEDEYQAWKKSQGIR